MAKKSTSATATITTNKVEFKTEDLQELCTKVAKGVGNDKIKETSALLRIKLEKNIFTITSTDLTTNVEVKKDKVKGSDFELLIKADPFIKLVSKTTSKDIILKIVPSKSGDGNMKLEVKGNGNYSFETVMLPEGDIFPDYSFGPDDAVETVTIKRAIINRAVSNSKQATSDDNADDLLTAIYFGDEVMSSDAEKAAALSISVFDKEVLLRPETINLLSIFEDDDLNVVFCEDRLIISDSKSIVYTAQMPDIDQFPVDAIKGTIYEAEYPYTCLVDKAELLACIDRLCIFTGNYKVNAIELVFGEKSVTLSNKFEPNAAETIDYAEGSEGCKHFTQSIKAEALRGQIEVVGKTVKISYGNDTALKITNDDLELVVAFLEDEQLAGE